MNEPLVIIITPCFNGGKTIARMIESVLAQTYGNIEYILVNDGSTDGTENVVLPYKVKFEEKGYRFIYVKQTNGGLGSAINAGLRVFSGDYLCWADADDFYAPASVALRVEWLDAHPDYGVVTSDAYVVAEGRLETPVDREALHFHNNEDECQFWHLLRGNSIFCAGVHMVRSAFFLKLFPERSIYPTRRGQNWQLLLPMYYHYKRHFLDQPLYFYVINPDSMSKDHTPEQALYRCNEHEDILTNTLRHIDMTETDREKADREVCAIYAKKRLSIAFRIGDAELAEVQVRRLKELGTYSMRNRLYLFGSKHKWFRKLLRRNEKG